MPGNASSRGRGDAPGGCRGIRYTGTRGQRGHTPATCSAIEKCGMTMQQLVLHGHPQHDETRGSVIRLSRRHLSAGCKTATQNHAPGTAISNSQVGQILGATVNCGPVLVCPVAGQDQKCAIVKFNKEVKSPCVARAVHFVQIDWLFA